MISQGRRGGSWSRGVCCWVLGCGGLFAACGGRTLGDGDWNGFAAAGGTAAAPSGAEGVGASAAGMATVGPVRGGSPTQGGRASTGVAGAMPGSGGASGGLVEGGRAQGGFAPGGGEGGHAESGAGPVVAGAAGAVGASCEFEGKTYQVGERFTDGCKLCDCVGDGLVSCSDQLCKVLCLRVAKEFAKTNAAGKICDPTDPLACQATTPRSLKCGCPVPIDSVAEGETASRLRERWLELECGTTDPNCACDSWETAFCSDEGRCVY